MKPYLPQEFYLQEDVIEIAKALLGKFLFTCFDNILTGGMIVETECYNGITDKASHAYKGRLTPRTKTMYEKGGVAYVYTCYGMHNLLNVVTNRKGIPHAILIRAIEPTHGIKKMLERRSQKKLQTTLTSGPGSLTKALGISKDHDGISFMHKKLWLEDNKKNISNNNIISSPRVGVSYAEEDALLPWRFRIKKNLWCSPAK